MSSALRDRVAVLRDRDVRRLVVGHAVSVFGDGLYWVAAMWFVYSLTGSTFYTGLAGFLARAPGVLRVLVGPLVDRWPIKPTLVGSEVAQGAVVLAIPALALVGGVSVGAVLVVVFLLAVSGVFAGPVQNVTLPRVVDDESLVRANAVVQTGAQVARAGSRVVAGVLVVAVGATALYAFDAATFAGCALLFATITIPARDRSNTSDETGFDRREYFADLRAGFAVIRDSVVGRMLAAVLLVNALLGGAMAVLPAFAGTVSSGSGADVYGYLLAGMTVGSILGSLCASAVDRLPFGSTAIVGFVVSGCCWVGAVLVPGLLPTVALFAASQVPIGVYNVEVQATLQTGVPDDLLGRVSATIGSATSLVSPFGVLIGGALGARFGSQTLMLGGGVGILLTAVYWLVDPSLRRLGPPTDVTRGAFA